MPRPQRCPWCHGTGKKVDHYDDQGKPVWKTCKHCSGRGYVYES